jgi:GST-like protein
VLDKRLADRGYLAGEYSVADIAVWPWLRRPDRQGVEIADHPNVKRWFDAIAARPAVERGLNVLAEKARATPSFDPKAQEVLFGATQYQKH